MPCRYDETPDEIEKRQKAARRKLIQPYKKELDLVTRLFCSVMTMYENGTQLQFEQFMDRNEEVQSWWDEHKQMDERRKINEKAELRKKAMDKLTAEEKKLLGLVK